MDEKRSVSEQLRLAIEKCGKSRYQLSQESGISQAVLSRFVRAESNLSMANAEKLCQCIGAELVLIPIRHKKRTKQK